MPGQAAITRPDGVPIEEDKYEKCNHYSQHDEAGKDTLLGARLGYRPGVSHDMRGDKTSRDSARLGLALRNEPLKR